MPYMYTKDGEPVYLDSRDLGCDKAGNVYTRNSMGVVHSHSGDELYEISPRSSRSLSREEAEAERKITSDFIKYRELGEAFGGIISAGLLLTFLASTVYSCVEDSKERKNRTLQHSSSYNPRP